MRRLFFLLPLLLLTGIVSAQDAPPQYHLHVPTVQEFFSKIPSIVNESYVEDPRHLAQTVDTEMTVRYTEEEVFSQNFAALWSMYAALAIGVESSVTADPYQWNLAMLRAWLLENPTNLSHMSQLESVAFKIEIMPRDFDNDGHQEYLLKLANKFGGVDELYILAQPNPKDETGYSLSLTPLPFTGMMADVFTRWKPETGELKTVSFGDINKDGLPEWLVLSDGFGYWQSCSKLYILAWRSGGLVDLATSKMNYCLELNNFPQWKYPVINGLTQIEIVNDFTDDWDCTRHLRQTLRWTSNQYILDDKSTYEFPPNCVRHLLDIIWQKGRDFVITGYNRWNSFVEPPMKLDALSAFDNLTSGVYGNLHDKNYSEALKSLDNAPFDEQNLPSNEAIIFNYLRALTLEALNRPDDALSDYIAIYSAAPDSAWGKLAALHLERLNP